MGRLDILNELQLQEDGITSRLGVFDLVKHDSGGCSACGASISEATCGEYVKMSIELYLLGNYNLEKKRLE
jgi:hypothetical protein